jgi:hypothetical protein
LNVFNCAVNISLILEIFVKFILLPRLEIIYFDITKPTGLLICGVFKISKMYKRSGAAKNIFK